MAVSWPFCIRHGFVMCSSSLASAPGANHHAALAQLPAYWRRDGRNDTRSGRRLPSIGNTTSPRSVRMRSPVSMSPRP